MTATKPRPKPRLSTVLPRAKEPRASARAVPVRRATTGPRQRTVRTGTHDLFPRLGQLAQATMLLSLLLPALTQADVVEPHNRPAATGVRIVELKDGQLHYRRTSDRVISRPIDEIAFIEIADWPLFNQAEQHRRQNRWRQATELYEQALADLPADNAEPGQLDRRLLVQCRLIGAYDAQGRFDRAVETYLQVVERMPAVVDALRPVNLPAAGSTFLPAAISAVDAAIRRHEHGAVGVSLARWRATWPSQTSATDDNPMLAPRQAVEHAAGSIAIREVTERLTAGRFDEAAERAAEALRWAGRVHLPELYYLLGRAHHGKVAGLTGSDGLREARRAGLAFMRIVIHFPRHDLAAECLYHAGTLCREAGQADQARGLWEELLREYPRSPWAGQAREAIQQLKP